jgi:Protein of Unknown function (DUF2784)
MSWVGTLGSISSAAGGYWGVGYRVLAAATMIVHFAFLCYVVAGGFLAWRWPRALWPHLAMAGWGFSTLVFHQECPLSLLEDWARRQAGEPGLKHRGFIETYLTGVVYPAGSVVLVQMLAAVVVAVSWAGAVLRQRHEPAAAITGR